MVVTNIHEAKTNLSKLIERALGGEDIVIAKAGEPQVRLVPYTESRGPRRGGQWKGMVRIGDDFEAPLPGEILKAFAGKK